MDLCWAFKRSLFRIKLRMKFKKINKSYNFYTSLRDLKLENPILSKPKLTYSNLSNPNIELFKNG
jgi:hypothetical protein